ncbi:MAG: hypothetical protein R3191_02265 [Anaerolineales bacterium]|nr:hypothetical protein [Anaerolineales bacterium]
MERDRSLPWSSLGRTLDFRLANHRWMAGLVVLGAAVAAAAELLQAQLILDVGIAAFTTGAAVFLGWAIGRELDPDHPRSALMAGIGSGAAALMVGSPSIIISGWALVMTRLIARTTGAPAKPLDALGVLGVGVWLGLERTPVFTGLTALGLAIDGWLAPSQRRQKLAAVVAALLTPATGYWTPLVSQETQSLAPLVLVVFVVLFGLFFALPVGRGAVQAVGDYTGERLRTRRVRGGQIFAALTVLLLLLIEGFDGLTAAGTLWAAAAGITAFHLLAVVGSRLRRNRGNS